MKPDVATVPAEPTETLEAAAIAEEAANEEQLQEESPSPPQHEEPKKEGADSTAPPPEKKTNGKTLQSTDKTKAPVKNKPSTAVTKTTNAASRSAPAQNRVANGVTRTAANGATKKTAPAASEAKKSVPVGAAAQAKKGPVVAAVALRTSTKAAERKPVGPTRPAVASTNSGTKPGAVANTTSLGKKPSTAANSAAVKPKTTAPRPSTALAAKPSISTTSRTVPGTKTTRPTTAHAPHSTTSSASIRPTATTTKPAPSRTVSAPSAARSASLHPSKASTTTAAAKKDVGKPSTSAPARKMVATKTSTQHTATKTSKPEPLRPAAAAKRPPPDTKTSRLKVDENKSVPTRKVPPSPRNTAPRPASSKTATVSHSQKQGGSSTPVAVKRQTSKPTQSVSPLVIKGKSTEEQAVEPVEPSSASLATVSAAALAAAESVPEVETTSAVQLEKRPDEQISVPVEVQEDEVVQMTALGASDIEIVPTVQQDDVEPLAIQPEAEVPSPEVSSSASIPFGVELQNDDDYVLVSVPAVEEVTQQELVTAPPFGLCVAAPVLPKGGEVIEKVEQLIHNDVDEEEEEKEGSQQVSVSDMSGTQPTEESRPGSAGLTGSVWRAGGLLSEPDSEDVSCSQQGASELSAPGVLEGTESMDDLGEASLKGADAEGASAGSPDFEKVPDIPANEDDDDDYDDEDRVCDMEVGSERAEDPHRQCHDNEDEEDEDVEMASEGITESGLESYGNADEDDFAEDYRLDNLNRMQPPPIVPSAPPAAQWDRPNLFADPWAQPLQPDPTLSSPSSSPWQANMEIPIQAPYQGWLDVENAKGGPSCQSPALIEPIPSSPQLAPVPSAEDASFNPGLAPYPQGMSLSNTSSGPEQAAHSFSDTSTPEELKDYNVSSGLENQQQQPAPVSPIPAALPDIMQDLGIQIEQSGEEEEPETLPADVLGGPATAPISLPSSPSSATEDEASDTEGEMQISESNVEPVATGNECSGSTQVAHSLSTLEEREDACVETEGGGGSDTPQSATSAASYGFDCTTTSNSNAQSTTESCAKSPGIFSLENEEQLPEEAKDPSLIKELNLQPTCAPGDADQLHLEQRGDLQPNSEQQYMLCGKASEELPEPCSQGGIVPVEGLVNPSSPQHQEEDWDLDAQHPYYSTICEKNDSSLAGRNNRHQQEVLTIHMTMSPKRHPRPHVDHVTNPPRLPTDLPPRLPSVRPNAQLRRLEHHQQQLRQIEQRREQQSQWVETQEEERIGAKEHEASDYKNCHGDEKKEEGNQMEEELEEKRMREEKEKELEEQRRNLLQLQIQQQQQELKQRQQIMQWQQELEQQNKHPNKQHKTVMKVLYEGSPSGLGTIYESLEISDAEEDLEEDLEDEMVKEDKAEYETPKDVCSKMESTKDLPQDNTCPQTQSTCSLKFIQDQVGLPHPLAPDSPPLNPSEQPSPLELDWGKKVDIVQQLINQTLLLAGDSCSPLLLLPGGAGGTLSPLETSLWPNLLPPLTPPSATVTSVSSFSPEASGSSSQGEWTVVELETHH